MLGIGVVGAGGFAAEHLLAFRQIPTAAVVGIADVDEERARAAAFAAGGVRWTTDYRELLGWPEVQAVDICTPNFAHAAIGLDAVRAGHHVLVEKPIATELGAADELLRVANECGVTLMVGFIMRHFPLGRTLRSIVDAGEIGRPRFVRLSLQAGLVWAGAWRAWQQDRSRSGGHLVHNGSHLFDLATWLLGETPSTVYAQAYRHNSPAAEVDDHWVATIEFDGGGTAVCEYTYSLPDPDAVIVEARVLGDRGAATHSSLDAPLVLGGGGHSPQYEMRGDSMRRELTEFVEAILDGRSLSVSPEDARRALAVSLAAQQSLDTARPVRLTGVMAHA